MVLTRCFKQSTMSIIKSNCSDELRCRFFKKLIPQTFLSMKVMKLIVSPAMLFEVAGVNVCDQQLTRQSQKDTIMYNTTRSAWQPLSFFGFRRQFTNQNTQQYSVASGCCVTDKIEPYESVQWCYTYSIFAEGVAVGWLHIRVDSQVGKARHF